jgi:YHS domain-containing protein
VIEQPGAAVDQKTYCPVSGVAFSVKELSVKRELDGKTIYFCCNGCAEYFDAHREHVIKKRGFAVTPSHPTPPATR